MNNWITTRPSKPPTLMQYWPDLEQKDKALILRAYNQWRCVTPASVPPKGPEAHLGLLPFISMHKISLALTWMATEASEYRHVWAKLCSKVEAARWKDGDMPAHSSWEMILVDALVHKHFGARPELGVHLPMIPKQETRGPLKWHVAYQAWKPEKIQAAPRITLRRLNSVPLPKGGGRWLLHAPTRYKELCVNWLLDHCK